MRGRCHRLFSAYAPVLFFARSKHQGDTEKLAIFGRKRGRRGAELKVMAAVETKVPGYFTDKMTIGETENDSDGFGTKTLVLKVRARCSTETQICQLACAVVPCLLSLASRVPS